VHIDGSARPQIHPPDINPLYYDIVVAFERAPASALINTSLMCIESPSSTGRQSACGVGRRRIDFVVTENGLYTMRA